MLTSMKQMSGAAADRELDELWQGLKTEWFSMEVLQDYSLIDDSPSLRTWLKGDKRAAIELLKEDDDPQFTAECRQKRSAGVVLTRVHILEQPLTAYVEWELEYYKHISRALGGEKVYTIDKSEIRDLVIPAGDLTVFDNSHAALNHYTSGELIGTDFYDSADDRLSLF